VAIGAPLQLGVELELPVITLDLLGEVSGGGGYGNLLEYHLAAWGNCTFSKKSAWARAWAFTATP
jgi:hypothetical protein